MFQGILISILYYLLKLLGNPTHYGGEILGNLFYHYKMVIFKNNKQTECTHTTKDRSTHILIFPFHQWIGPTNI